jgi:hypothetical protein
MTDVFPVAKTEGDLPTEAVETRALPSLSGFAPMDAAAILLADLCARIDSGEDPEGALLAAFEDTRLSLSDAVDRRIAFDAWSKGAVATAQESKKLWDKRIKVLQNLRDRFLDRTKQIVEMVNDGDAVVPFKGKLGEIVLHWNPEALDLDEKMPTSSADRKAWGFWRVPAKYIRKTVTYSIDKDAVKAAIGDGKKFKWAKIKREKRLKFKV